MTNFLKRFLTRGMAEAQEQKPQKPKEITEVDDKTYRSELEQAMDDTIQEFERESVVYDEIRRGDDCDQSRETKEEL